LRHVSTNGRKRSKQSYPFWILLVCRHPVGSCTNLGGKMDYQVKA
jgi:hypothetical protein